MKNIYFNANQSHQTNQLVIWKFLWVVSLIFSTFLAQAQPCSTSLDFSSAIATGPTQAPNTWYTDRYAPAGFAAQSSFDGGDRLKHSISTADGAATRSGGQQDVFYNTQGRKLDLISGVKSLEIKLYIPSAWALSNKRMAGLWGTATNASNAPSGYPIIEFTSDGNNPRFRGYESGGAGSWVDLGLPAGFAYNQWVTLKMQLLASGEFQYTVGNLTYTTTTSAPDASKQIANVILQGHNYDPVQPLNATNTGVTYDIFWDDFSVKAGDGVVTNTNTSKTFCSIQAAIDDPTTANGHNIVVSAGTYNEDVSVNKSLTITGAGAGSTTIIGPIGGPAATVQLAANGITLAGFTITRDGNDPTNWNNANLNSPGIAIQGVALSGITIRDNIITGNRSGIDINNSNGHTVRNNVINNNHTGVIFRNQTDNITFTENVVTDNRTVGILFLDASSGSNSPVQTASGSNFTNNNISANWYGQVVDRQSGGSVPAPGTTNLKNFSSNWYGTTSPVVTTANSAEPGYAALIPVVYGGTAMAPSGQPDIAGAASANIDFTPFFASNTDTDVETTTGWGTNGFQGSFSTLWATATGAQTGEITRIQEGVNLTTASGILNVKDGTYNEEVTINKALNLKGANAGTPGNGTRVTESILTGNNGAHSGFVITSSNVTIDGFTVTGAGGTYGAGIYSSPATSAVTVKCNIITDNVIGVYPSSNGASFVNNNLFNANNRPGPSGGAGLYVEETNTLTVELNEFKGHTLNSAVIFATSANKHQNLNFSRNYIHDNNDANSMVYLNGINGGTFSYNNIVQSGATAIKLAGGNSNVTLVHNELNGNATGVKIQNDGPGPNTGIQIHENSVSSTTAINNLDVALVDATCNWYGSNVAGDVAAKVFGSVTYLPFTNNGTDNNGAGIGFEPVPGSCIYPVHNLTHPKDFATIQSAINDPITEPGDVIQADNGTYNEDVVINKAITLQGESRNGTIIKGLRRDNVVGTGATRTVNVTTSNVTIKTLTVTRDYNGNEAGWKASTKTEGIIIENQDNLTLDNVLVKDNRTGVYLHNTKNTIVKNSEIVDNRTGFQVWGPLDNTQITNNFIMGNFTHGIVFNFDQGPTSAPGMQITNNNISGNWYTQISFQRGSGTPAANVGDFSTLDLTCNWYGALPTTTVGPVSAPGYDTQTTSQFGGTAPATTLYIAGEEAAGKNFVPYLNNGTDNDGGTAGFQPVPGSCVSPIHNLTHAKDFGTIQAAINDPITEPGDVIKIDAGTYTENFTVTKSLKFEGANKDICGTDTRGAETILIAPATPTGVITLSGPVSATFNGVKIDGLGVAYLNDPAQSLTIKNSVFELDFVSSQNNLYSNASAVTLDCNYFKAMGGTNDGGSSSHIFIGNGSLTATNNKFTSETAVAALTGGTNSLPVWLNLTSNTNSISVQGNLFTKVDIGILLAANAGGGTIQNNEFSEAKRAAYPGGSGFGTGIAIFGNYTPAAPVSIQNNKFYNSETGIRTSSGDASNNFPAPSLLTISNNSFETLSAGSFRIGASFNSSTNALNATCNWFLNASVVTGNPANITYLPKLVSGTDDSPAIGFQTSAACLLPVHNITKNTYFATIQAAISDMGTTNGDEIVASDGTYNERVTVSKQVTLTGASKAGTILDGTGLSGTGSGIFINNGITNVTIKNFTIQNFTGSSGNSHAGIYANAENNNLTITDVVIKNNPSASGIYANGPVSDVLIDKVDALNNGPSARGIVIWNGLKKNITITNSNVQNNTCCGIELQDGSATGVLIKGNTIVGNDNAIGLVGLTSGSGLGKANIIENNTLTVNGRFGIEVKNPNGTGRDVDTEDGAIIIRSNTITFGSTTDQRDLAGIAIHRRAVLPGNVDVPTGVVVKNNTVSGFKQSSTSDGFGIVVEGTNHTVTGNTLNNNDIGIQLQAGNGMYPGNSDDSNLADTYFGRGNSPLTCGNIIAPNTFSGNAANTRDVGASTGGGTVTNTNTGKTFCSIQSAINDPTTLNGHTITVGAGTYNEEVTVSKSLTLTGANVGVAGNGSRGAETVVDGNIGTHSGFVVTVNNVTIDGFRINGAGGSSYGAGVYSSPTTSGLVLQNNVISDNVIGAYPSSNGASWVKRNLFVANNRPGAAGGAGIYVEATSALTIDGNEFRGHTNNSAVILSASAPNAHQNLVFTNNYVHDNNNANSMVYLSGVNSATISSNTVVQSGTTAIKIAGGDANITLTNNVLDGNTTALKVQNDGVGPNTGVQATNNSLVSTKSVDNQDVNDVTLTCNFYGVTNYAGVLAKLVAGSTGKNLLTSIATTNTYTSCISPTGLALLASATATCVSSPASVTVTGLLASTSTIATYAVNDGTPQTYTATTTSAGELIISVVMPAGPYTLRVTALEATGTVATINPPLSATGMVQSSVVAGTVSGASPIGIGGTTTYTNTGGSPGGTWSSSDPAVATVNNAGLVTGVASGTANIIYTVTGCNGSVSSQATVTVQNVDLAPGIYALPATLYGTAPFTIVVDVFELNQVPTNGTITVVISKDPKFNLSFTQNATFVGNRVVQNGSWTLISADSDSYILTTSAPINGGGKLSLGLNGLLSPNNTSGAIPISVTVSGTNEVQLGNNTNAITIQYFKQ